MSNWYDVAMPQLREAPLITVLIITESNTHEAEVLLQVMKGTIQILGATYRILSFTPVAKIDAHITMAEIIIQQELDTK